MIYYSLKTQPYREFSDFFSEFELAEEDEKYMLEIPVPGFKKDHINLTVENDRLDLDAQNGNKKLSKQIKLCEGIEMEKISASIEDGILSISLPKISAVRPRKISIQ